MATTEERLRVGADNVDLASQRLDERLLDQEIEEVLRSERRPSSVDRYRAWCHILLGAWGIVLVGLIALAPTPDDPNAPIAASELLLSLAFFGALAAVFSGLARSTPWAVRGATIAAAIGVVAGIACRATAHHTGGWWIAETAAFGGLLLLSSIASKKTSMH